MTATQTPAQQVAYYGRELTADDARELEAIEAALRYLLPDLQPHQIDNVVEAFVHPDLRPAERAQRTTWSDLAERLLDVLHDAIALTIKGSADERAVRVIADATTATVREAQR